MNALLDGRRVYCPVTLGCSSWLSWEGGRRTTSRVALGLARWYERRRVERSVVWVGKVVFNLGHRCAVVFVAVQPARRPFYALRPLPPQPLRPLSVAARHGPHRDTHQRNTMRIIVKGGVWKNTEVSHTSRAVPSLSLTTVPLHRMRSSRLPSPSMVSTTAVRGTRWEGGRGWEWDTGPSQMNRC